VPLQPKAIPPPEARNVAPSKASTLSATRFPRALCESILVPFQVVKFACLLALLLPQSEAVVRSCDVEDGKEANVLYLCLAVVVIHITKNPQEHKQLKTCSEKPHSWHKNQTVGHCTGTPCLLLCCKLPLIFPGHTIIDVPIQTLHPNKYGNKNSSRSKGSP
jgi:hypothetical protein